MLAMEIRLEHVGRTAASWSSGRRLRNTSLGTVEVKCENFCELLDMERTDGNCETEETTGMFAVVLINIFQNTSISFIQGP